jgi:hypothetical protein
MQIAERHGVAERILVLVVEVVVPLRIGAHRRIVLVGTAHEGSDAAPAVHELRGEQLLTLGRLAVLAQEIAELPDVLFEPSISHVGSVAHELGRLWQMRRRAASHARPSAASRKGQELVSPRDRWGARQHDVLDVVQLEHVRHRCYCI